MKKTMILAGMLSIGYASAQQGNTGINTSSPNATLEVKVAGINANNGSNQGIIAPILSKTRVASINTPVEGTLVYVSELTYTGADTKVSDINEKGYYFYNGTQWIKASAGTSVASNIYTADGTLTGDRKVTMGDKILSFEGNNGAKYLEVKNASWYPLVVNSTNTQGGGIAVHPNNLDNRAEFSVNANGDIRFYQNGSGDVMFIKKTGTIGGLVGIGNTNPKVRLDVTGGGRFKRVGSSSTIEIDTDNNQWGHLDFRRNDVKRWDIGMTNGEETGSEAGSNFFISSFKDDGSFNGSGLFINRQTGNTGLGTDKPQSRLDVTGEIIARGQAQTDAYFGGDNVPAVPGRPMYDVEIGSIKAGVTDISLYNRADATAMNLYANSVNTFGTLQSNSLAGDGDKIVIANNDGTLTKGVSISNFATSNIYTANGTLTSNRVVDQAGKWLDFNNGGIRITGNDGVYFPLSINTKHSGGNGGIVINPNGDGAKRVELNSTPEGDFRLWLDGDKIYVNRSTGNVGLSVGTNPAARLDVSGELIARGQTGEIEAYFGGDGVGGDVEVGSIKAGVTDVTLYNRGDSKAMRLVSGDVNARGEIKATSLAGDGDKIVIANNDGTLTKGVSISNFATSNIYTADGSTNGDRTVSTANGFLTIKGNAWNPLVVNSEIDPGDPANNARGGLAVHPNDMEKRVEFATTKDGDSRIWLDGDKVFIKRATGNVGIGTVDPSEKLDVAGSIKSTALAGTGNRNVMADKDGKLIIGEKTTPIRTETTETTLAITDNGGYVYINSANAVNVTVPANLPVGFSCIVVQKGTGQVTIVAGADVTHETARGTKTRARHSAVGIIKDTESTFTITGDAID